MEVKRIFKHYGVISRIIELDYADGFHGNSLEVYLKKRIGEKVNPAIYIDGEYRGGLPKLTEDVKDGKFHEYLKKAKAKYDASKFEGKDKGVDIAQGDLKLPTTIDKDTYAVYKNIDKDMEKHRLDQRKKWGMDTWKNHTDELVKK
jgi:hypothetical protein